MIVLLCITDGRRDHIARTIPSALEHLDGFITSKLIYDDSADPSYRSWLVEEFGPSGFTITHHPDGRQGFGGAIRYCWQALAGLFDEKYVFATEDDFVFNRRVDLRAMCDVLRDHPNIVQLVLKRQAWNEEETAAGGIIEQHPNDYLEVCDGFNHWVEHRRFFSTNPYFARRTLCEQEWPSGPNSEGHFTHKLLGYGLPHVDPRDIRFAFWGKKNDSPWVEHIGVERVGHGY